MLVAAMVLGLSATANTKVIHSQDGEVNILRDLQKDKDILLNYMKIKDALVNDDFGQVKKVALNMDGGLEGVKINQAQHNSLENVIANIAKAENIGSQRKYFAQLSQHLYQLARKIDLTDKTLFLQSCGMAMGGQGAEWISYEKEVRNPFMGQKMPGCGSVEEKTGK